MMDFKMLKNLNEKDFLVSQSTKNANRVSLKDVKNKVSTIEYIIPKSAPHITICVLTANNGSVVVGTSTSFDPDHIDVELSRNFSYENALYKLWEMEKYLSREKLKKD